MTTRPPKLPNNVALDGPAPPTRRAATDTPRQDILWQNRDAHDSRSPMSRRTPATAPHLPRCARGRRWEHHGASGSSNSAHVGGWSWCCSRWSHQGLLFGTVPSNASGMAAKVCVRPPSLPDGPADAAILVHGRRDVTPANIARARRSSPPGSVRQWRTVTNKFLGLFKRRASLVSKAWLRIGRADRSHSGSYSAAAPDPAPWPQGDAVTTGVDTQTPEGRRRCIHRLRRTAGSQRPQGGSGAGRQIAHRSGTARTSSPTTLCTAGR